MTHRGPNAIKLCILGRGLHSFNRGRRTGMKYRLNIVALAAVAAIATPGILSAQQSDGLRLAQATPKSKQSPRVEPQYDIEELTPSQIQRAQEPDRPTAPTSPSTSIPPATM